MEDSKFDVFEFNTAKFLHSSSMGSLGDVDMNDILVDENDLLEQVFAAYPSPAQSLCGDQQQSIPSLPPYIAALPDHLPAEDLRYLQQRGCFTIPDLETRDRLLQAYTIWVHPFTPMLDLTSIINAVSGDMMASPVSLLVFQCMMLAAFPYCELDLDAKDRKDTRRMLFERCKTLHDFGIESNPLYILQSAVLMSFWDGDGDRIRDSYYWIGIATMHANGMGLYLDPTTGPKTSRRQKILKRTWWSLVMRDRLLAVALRRPVQVKASPSHVPMLQMEDFEIESLLEAAQNNLAIEELNLETLNTVMDCCTALAQLSEYIDQILSIQYSVQRTSGLQALSNKTISLVPKTSGINWTDITSSAKDLQNWCGSLPECVQQSKYSTQASTSGGRIVHVHNSLLAAYYSMTLMTLYRPILSLSSHREKERHFRRTAVKVVFQAAQGITASFGALYTEDLLSFLPETATAALEPAIVTHLLYSTSDVPEIKHHSIQRFYLCWNILLRLGEVYSLAETTVSMIRTAAQRLNACPTSWRKNDNPMPSRDQSSWPLASPRGRGPAVSPWTAVDVQGGEPQLGWEHEIISPATSMSPLHTSSVGMTGEAASLDVYSDAELFEQLVCWETGE